MNIIACCVPPLIPAQSGVASIWKQTQKKENIVISIHHFLVYDDRRTWSITKWGGEKQEPDDLILSRLYQMMHHSTYRPVSTIYSHKI